MSDMAISMERLRPDWVAALVRELQKAAGGIALADAEEAETVLRALIETLPVPKSHAESLVLRSTLLEVASRTGPRIHARAHNSSSAACRFVPGAVIETFWSVATDSPQHAFVRWMEAFFAQLRQAHPRSAASRVARVLRERYQESWPVPTLAQMVHTTPSQLSRQFRLEFGVSIPDYQRIARLIHALNLVRHEKAEAVALQVGYRSKKNFYATLQHFTGLTPTAFRRMSDLRAEEIVDSLRLSLQSHFPTDGVPRLAWSASSRALQRME
jgi:AraC-like DNA-binding protein